MIDSGDVSGNKICAPGINLAPETPVRVVAAGYVTTADDEFVTKFRLGEEARDITRIMLKVRVHLENVVGREVGECVLKTPSVSHS